ncbi:hypothetical protein UPYG_G00193170 [Umbra pygmaea]|uniref:Centrosomal protein 126 n=1 Tax=Umbra pygmaea TaxID=75934 RepID=A0ABD0WI78_UMBPY
MQAQKDNLLYSTGQIGVKGLFEVERQVLVLEQKSCRVQARRFSLETNRRRKVLEDKRKQWDTQEQTFRENILQQRKQRVLDVTERFQRAHLPPSQRRGQTFRKNTPDIEEALNHIQGNLIFSSSSILSSNSTISRSCTPSPKPPLTAKPSRPPSTLSALEDDIKLGQHSAHRTYRNSQLVKDLQGTLLQDRATCRSPQPVDHLTQSESSLSSQDSLENVDVTHSITNNSLPKAYICAPPPTAGQTDEAFGEPSSRLHPRYEATGGQSFTESLSSRSENETHVSDHSRLIGAVNTASTRPDRAAQHAQDMEDFPRDRVPVDESKHKAAKPDSFPLEFTSHFTPEGKQVKNQEDRNSKHPCETQVLLSGKNCSHKDLLCKAPNSSSEPDLSQTKCGEDTNICFEGSCYPPHRRKPCVDTMSNLTNESNIEPKMWRGKFPSEPVSLRMCCSNIRSDFPEGRPQVTMDTSIPPSGSADGTTTDPPKDTNVRFIKGILKKHAKDRVSGLYSVGNFMFPKKVAMSIRDSVELARSNVRNTEGIKKVKKKIRWLDEIELEAEQEKDTQPSNQVKNQPAAIPRDHLYAERQTSHHQAPTSDTSPGYEFTKQAWTDVRVQEHRGPRASNGRTWGPRRVRSARGTTGHVASRSRKCTVIRAPSVTEASRHVARVTQGQVMVPRPPPRTETKEPKHHPGESAAVVSFTTKNPYNGSYQIPAVSFITGHARAANAGFPVQQAVFHKDSIHTSHVIKVNNSVIFLPFPPSCTYPASLVTPPTSGQRDIQGGSSRRGLLYHEKGLCLERTPTEEEISRLWHGVRSALATEKGDPRSAGPPDVVCALTRAGANLSRAAIDGDSVNTGVKAVTRIGGFFVSSTSSRGNVRRPAQDSNAVGARRRGAPGSGNRLLPTSQSQASGKKTSIQTKSNLTYQDEDSKYATEADSNKLISMETIHTQRTPPGLPQQRNKNQGYPQLAQGLGQNEGQNQSLTTISLEEQKVLMSLDRLNHQLQYVQHLVGGTSATSTLLHGVPPCSDEGMAASNRNHSTASTNNCSKTQRRF